MALSGFSAKRHLEIPLSQAGAWPVLPSEVPSPKHSHAGQGRELCLPPESSRAESSSPAGSEFPPPPGEGLRAGASEILRLGAVGGLQVGAQLVHVVQGLREERPDGVDLHQGQVIQLEREKKPQNLRP